MAQAKLSERELLNKIQSLPPERVAEVEDFVDFLRQRSEEHRLTQASTTLAVNSFAQVWDNLNDADYDRL